MDDIIIEHNPISIYPDSITIRYRLKDSSTIINHYFNINDLGILKEMGIELK